VLRWLAALALVGCGRIGFDSLDGGAPLGDGAGATRWALVQTAGMTGPRATLRRLGAHHLVVVAVQSDGRVTAITDSSGCNAYVAIPASHATDRLGDDLQIFYAEDSCPEADAISVAATTKVFAAVVWEVAGIRTDDPLDTAAASSDLPATTAPVGPMIATTTAGEFVVSVAIVENDAPRIHAGDEFTNDETTNGNGWAHLTDPMAAAGSYQAQWDQPQPGVYCAAAAAFQVGP
jgi:hypothetical protein